MALDIVDLQKQCGNEYIKI